MRGGDSGSYVLPSANLATSTFAPSIATDECSLDNGCNDDDDDDDD